MQPDLKSLINDAFRHHEAGELQQAAALYRQVLQHDPRHTDALHLLGIIAQHSGHADKAIDLIQRAIQLKPAGPGAPYYYYNLAISLYDIGRLTDAENAYCASLSFKPDYAPAHNNLAQVLKEMGRVEEAIGAFRNAIANGNTASWSGLLHALYLSPSYTPDAVLAEHRTWAKLHADPIPRMQLSPRRDPDRILRVGYVSPDWRDHPVGRFMLPILKNHDRSNIHAICYSDVAVPDVMTAQMKPLAAGWHDVGMLSEQELAEKIRDDRVDILVDLAVHTRGNRMLMFARKPAPVQATYLGYPGTTGQTAVDYRLTDGVLDPPGLNDRYYAEQSIRLSNTYWCYAAPANSPPAAAAAHGPLTFGGANNFSKVSVPALKAWATILSRVPESRLVIYAAESTHLDRARAILCEAGVDPQRLQWAGFRPFRDYLHDLSQIDILLDSFPYSGGTTTCDALWMGAPVITLAGQLAVARASASLLTAVGLPELVTTSAQDYIDVAVRLASDRSSLFSLRQNLRQRMLDSPVMNAPAFVKDIERAYRAMWAQYCAEEK